MATSDKPDKPAKPRTTRSRSSRASTRKKATRAPIIDLEATEVAPESDKADKAASSAPATEDTGQSRQKPADSESPAPAAKAAAAAKGEDKKTDESPAPASPKPKKAEARSKAQSTASEKDAAKSAPAAKSTADTSSPSASARSRPQTSTAGASKGPKKGQPKPQATPSQTGSTGEGSRSSLVAVGGAAAAGALLCLAVLVGLDRAGVLPWRASPADGVDPAALEAKIESLESQLSGLAARQEPPDTGLTGRVAGLEKDIQTAGEAVGALPGLIEKLDERLSGFETSLTETQTKAQTALSGLENIETAVSTIGERAGEASPTIEALELKLSTLSTKLDRVASEIQGGSPDEVAARIDGLDKSLGEIKSATEALGQQIKDLTGRVAALPESVTPDAFGKARNEMETRLDAIEARLGGPGEVRGAASAIALADLRRVLDRGQPFQSELSAFSSLVPDDAVVPVLAPHAATGLKTRAELLASFRTASQSSGKEPEGTSEAPDLTGAILSRLQSVVQVRRTGDDDGRDTGAIAARMGKAVGAGDLEGAIARGGEAAEALPVPLKTWIDSAKARVAADKAMAEAEARMLAALARSGG